ncbi:MAG TPA: hypothetical protein VK993_00105, partial [Chthoniobacterales bacterium]|nr:hypothetical protein [Chthoniobacterales bacterium]
MRMTLRSHLAATALMFIGGTAAFGQGRPPASPSPSPSPQGMPAIAPVVPAAVAAVKPKELSLVRVNVTGQPYDYARPWQKKAPFQKRALGAVLPKGRVLVTADLVANQNYVELERAETGDKTAAEVRVVDYEANLALVEP